MKQAKIDTRNKLDILNTLKNEVHYLQTKIERTETNGYKEKINFLNKISILEKENQKLSNNLYTKNNGLNYEKELLNEKNKEINKLRRELNFLSEKKMNLEKENNSLKFKFDDFENKFFLLKKEKELDLFRMHNKKQDCEENLQHEKNSLNLIISDLRMENSQLRKKIDFLSDNLLEKEKGFLNLELEKKHKNYDSDKRYLQKRIKNQILFNSENIFIFQKNLKEKKIKNDFFLKWKLKLVNKLKNSKKNDIRNFTKFQITDLIKNLKIINNSIAKKITKYYYNKFSNSLKKKKLKKSSFQIFKTNIQNDIKKNNFFFSNIINNYFSIYNSIICLDLNFSANMNLYNDLEKEKNQMNLIILKNLVKHLNGSDDLFLDLYKIFKILFKIENPLSCENNISLKMKNAIYHGILNIFKDILEF